MLGSKAKREQEPQPWSLAHRITARLTDYEAFIADRAGQPVIVTTKPQGGEHVITCRLNGEVVVDSIKTLGRFSDGDDVLAAAFRAWVTGGAA